MTYNNDMICKIDCTSNPEEGLVLYNEISND